MRYLGLVDNYREDRIFGISPAMEALEAMVTCRVYGDEMPLPDRKFLSLRAKYCRLNQPKYFPSNWLCWLDLVYNR